MVNIDNVGLLGRQIREAFGSVRLVRQDADSRRRTIITIPVDRYHGAASGTEVVGLIQSQLGQLGSAALRAGDWSLSVPAVVETGFTIEVFSWNGRLAVLFADMEVEFPSFESAMVWVERALSKTYRLQILKVSGKPREWRLEPISGATPSNSLAVGHGVFFCSWRTHEFVVLSNGFE